MYTDYVHSYYPLCCADQCSMHANLLSISYRPLTDYGACAEHAINLRIVMNKYSYLASSPGSSHNSHVAY